MAKVKIFVSKSGFIQNIESEINEFLSDKKFISLTQSQSFNEHATVVTFTLVYEEESKIKVMDL